MSRMLAGDMEGFSSPAPAPFPMPASPSHCRRHCLQSHPGCSNKLIGKGEGEHFPQAGIGGSLQSLQHQLGWFLGGEETKTNNHHHPRPPSPTTTTVCCLLPRPSLLSLAGEGGPVPRVGGLGRSNVTHPPPGEFGGVFLFIRVEGEVLHKCQKSLHFWPPASPSLSLTTTRSSI